MTGWTVKDKQSMITYIIGNLLNTTRCGKLLYSKMNTRTIISYVVKMSLTWEQSAWVLKILISIRIIIKIILLEIKNKFYIILNYTGIKNKNLFLLLNSSETKRSAFSSGILKNNINFNEWFVGFTDGDGSFYFAKSKKGYWTFTFKIGQSNYNLRVLYYIKSMIGVGSVSIPNSKDNTAEYRVRNIQHIIKYIIPIFEKYPLLTSKYFNYNLFKQAIIIMNDSNLSKEEKDYKISNFKFKSLPENYISPAWQTINYTVSNINDAMKVMTKSWLIGFTEASGKFILIKNNTGQIVHVFEINITNNSIQKCNDSIIFIAITKLINIKNPNFSLHYLNNVKIYINKLQIKDYESFSNIILFYHNTMKGMKSLEYRIWSRSFIKGNNKEKNKLNYLEKVYKINSKVNFKLTKSFFNITNIQWNTNKIMNYQLNIDTQVFSTKSSVNLIKYNFSLIPWGINLQSGLNSGRLSNKIRNMYELPYYQSSVLIGILISDGWSIYSYSTRKGGIDNSKLNARIGFRQSFDKFKYFFYVFYIFSHYCVSIPYLTIGKRNQTINKSLTFQTRALKCFTKYHKLFYVNRKKTIPPFEIIYYLINPIALAHWISGDGIALKKGLVLCTDSYTLKEVIVLINVLIIRYNFICRIRVVRNNQYRIYISEKSLSSLQKIVMPYMDSSMLYKIIH